MFVWKKSHFSEKDHFQSSNDYYLKCFKFADFTLVSHFFPRVRAHTYRIAITVNYSQLLQVFHSFYAQSSNSLDTYPAQNAYVDVIILFHPKKLNSVQFLDCFSQSYCRYCLLFVSIIMVMTHFNLWCVFLRVFYCKKTFTLGC